MDAKKKVRVLVIGPSANKSNGGIASVINEMKNNVNLDDRFHIDYFSSYVGGNIIVRMFFSVFALMKFFCIYRKYDLFHIHMAAYGSVYRKSVYAKVINKARKKMIIHIHGAKILVFFREISSSKKRYLVNVLNNSDIVVALSESWKKDFECDFGLKNVLVLKNRINHKVFGKCIINSKTTISNFLFLGKLCERKGVYDLIEAIEMVKKDGIRIKCYLAGDGEIGRVKELVRRKGIEDYVEFVGWVNLEDKIELLKKVAVVVLPSYHEGLPMALIEGMAAGKLIISTNVGAITDLVEDAVNGIIISPGDVEGLKNALICYSKHSEEWEKMSARNVSKVINEYSIQHINMELDKIYSLAVSN